MSKQTAVTPLRELIESGKNFGDFILKGPSLAPSGPQGPQRAHSNQRVPLGQVRVLMPRQGRFSESNGPLPPPKTSQHSDCQKMATASHSETPFPKSSYRAGLGAQTDLNQR